jgi:hypothetical protein
VGVYVKVSGQVDGIVADAYAVQTEQWEADSNDPMEVVVPLMATPAPSGWISDSAFLAMKAAQASLLVAVKVALASLKRSMVVSVDEQGIYHALEVWTSNMLSRAQLSLLGHYRNARCELPCLLSCLLGDILLPPPLLTTSLFLRNHGPGGDSCLDREDARVVQFSELLLCLPSLSLNLSGTI